MSLKFSSIPQKRLLQGITSASSTFYVNNILSFDGLTDVSSSDLGTQHYVCFRNDTGTIVEFMEIDPSTISTGPITIVRRGLSFYGDRTTETTALKLDWPINSIVQFGTDVPQIFQYLKEYIDSAAIAGAVPASTTAAGIVVEASQAEVDAGTGTKVVSSVTYDLFAKPNLIRAKAYHDYAVDSVGSDAYAITITPAITAYAAGQVFTFKAGTANTGACSLNVSGLGAKTIKKNVSDDLETGDILANQIVMVQYDGTNMQLLSFSSLVSTNINTINTRAQYTVGALDNALVKTYFNIQLPFILWTGAVANDTTTTFVNWERNSTDAYVSNGGVMVDFQNTGADQIYLQTFFLTNTLPLRFNTTNKIILDWWAKLPASGTGDINMGFGGATDFNVAYNDSSVGNRVVFAQKSTGELYATIAKPAVGVTNTDISSGLTLTNWNNYRIELDLSNNALFYVNGTLKATLSGANLPNGSANVSIGFGRSNTSLFMVTAPTLSLEMNP